MWLPSGPDSTGDSCRQPSRDTDTVHGVGRCVCCGGRYGTEMGLALRRWRRKAQGKIVMFLGAGVIIVLINIICGLSFMDGRSSVEFSTLNLNKDILRRALVDRNSEDYIREQLRNKRLEIFQRIFEKHNHRTSRNNQTCQHPHLDLKHDANKEAFYKMEPLNCTGTTLFNVRNMTIHLDETVLGERELGRCLYFGVERMTDDFFSYTESLEKKEPPFDLILNHDFIRIQCTSKSTENERAKNDYPAKRRLLSKIYISKPPNHSSLVSSRDRTNNIKTRNKEVIDMELDFSKQRYENKDKNSSKKKEKQFRNSSVVLTRKLKHMPDEQVVEMELKEPIRDLDKLNIHDENKNQEFVKEKNEVKWILEEPKKNQNSLVHNNVGYKEREDQNALAHEREGNELKNGFKEPVGDQDSSVHKREGINEVKDNKKQPIKEEGLGDEEGDMDVQEAMREEGGLGGEAGEEGDQHVVEDPFGMDEEEPFDYQPFFGAEFMDSDFDQYLVQVVPKPEVFERISKVKKNPYSSDMNVFVFALDSMSHLSYQRKLPLTYRYLKEELGATVLNGYNIVGDATTAAIIPMMTGKTEVELPEVRKDEEDANFLDVYPFIWKRFKEAGYATLYAEDEPSIGTFNLRFNGFQAPPTDHYMRPFWQAIWDSGLQAGSQRYCTGSTAHHTFLLDYIKDFFVKYENVSKFAFGFSGELTHWNNNPGQYIDKELRDLFIFLKSKGYLDNTMLVVMGDHGARYSKVRNTVQGKLEERLPMMSVVMPTWFLKKYPRVKYALELNGQRLTTPFDIHETFLDVLNTKRLEVPLGHDQRGMSILRNIPSNRTCESAQIDIHWCACLHQVQVAFDDKFVIIAASKVVGFINNLTRELRHNCTELSLKRIFSAYLVLPNEKVLKFTKSSDPDQRNANFSKAIDVDKAHYQITLETSPNDALYEVTVEVDFRNESYVSHVTPEISRLTLYGDQPKCIQKEHPDLRKYCYCRNFSQTETVVGQRREGKGMMVRGNNFRPKRKTAKQT